MSGNLQNNMRHADRGFTMLELAVVITLIGILVGVFIGPSSSLIISMRQSAAAAEVEREILAARSRAVAEGRPVGVYITGSTIDGTLSSLATTAGITASTYGLYPLELASSTSGSARISTSVIDSAAAPGTYSIAARFPGVIITSITGGSMAGTAIWFATDGTPEIRSFSGSRSGLQTSDIDILLSGGAHIIVRAGSGLVEVQ